MHPSTDVLAEIPQKIELCSRGFSKADWNVAYAVWVTAPKYCADEDSDCDPELIYLNKHLGKKMTNRKQMSKKKKMPMMQKKEVILN